RSSPTAARPPSSPAAAEPADARSTRTGSRNAPKVVPLAAGVRGLASRSGLGTGSGTLSLAFSWHAACLDVRPAPGSLANGGTGADLLLARGVVRIVGGDRRRAGALYPGRAVRRR